MVRASLGKEGGAFTQRRQNATAIQATYPMYGIKVTDVMAMTAWVPHQELRGRDAAFSEGQLMFTTITTSHFGEESWYKGRRG